MSSLLNQYSAPPTTETAQTNERPEFEVAKFVNLKLFGAIEVTARVFKDPTRQRGMSATQKQHHKNIAAVPAEQIMELVQQWIADGKNPIEIETIRDAGGTSDEEEVNLVKDLFNLPK